MQPPQFICSLYPHSAQLSPQRVSIIALPPFLRLRQIGLTHRDFTAVAGEYQRKSAPLARQLVLQRQHIIMRLMVLAGKNLPAVHVQIENALYVLQMDHALCLRRTEEARKAGISMLAAHHQALIFIGRLSISNVFPSFHNRICAYLFLTSNHTPDKATVSSSKFCTDSTCLVA